MKKKVLLAEDEELQRVLARHVLEKAGFEVELADNGRQAVEMFFSAPEKFQMIFLDFRMPFVNGIEAAAKIRGRGFTKVPIFALTAHRGKLEILECVNAGINEVFQKPLSLPDLSRILSRYSKDRRDSSEEIDSGLRKIAENLGFDEEMCAKYLKLFHDSAKTYLHSLSKAIKDGNSEKAADALHTIKGGAMSMKLDGVSELAERMEKIAVEGFLEEVEKQIEDLVKELQKVRIISIL